MTQSRYDLTDQLIELERAQIGHEIHDALLPLLFAASSGVASAIDHLPDNASESKQTLIQTSTWLVDAMQTARRLLKEIYPPQLVGSRWIRAAKDTIARLLEDSAVCIDWNTDQGVEDTSQQVALAAYRITVESIRNAIRHGQSKHIQINATKDDDKIEIVIRDDGNGFDSTKIPSDCFGIQAMRGRAALVGGSLGIDSQPGGPTIVTFKV